MSEPLNASIGMEPSEASVAAENAAFIRKVYAFMASGLVATGLTAMLVAYSVGELWFIFSSPLVWGGLCLAEIIMVWSFVGLVKRMSAFGAGLLFFTYAIVNGLTFSGIFLFYTATSIANAFFITAGTFGVMSVYGHVTKRDLSSVGPFMMMGLVGLLLASVVNLFIGGEMVSWVTSLIGVVVFLGLTAYDTQKLQELNIIGNQDTDEDHKEAIHGALVLYLDFINLFLNILRLVGRRR